MKERLLVGAVRVLLVMVVLAGSIVTFNFGLNEGLKPADYAAKIGALDHYCDFCLFPPPPGPLGPYPVNKSALWLALILLFVGASVLVWSILGHETERRRKKNIDAYLSRSWVIPTPRRIGEVSTRQLNQKRARIRRYKRIRI